MLRRSQGKCVERREEVKGSDWRRKRKGRCGQGKMSKERGKEEMEAIQRGKGWEKVVECGTGEGWGEEG